MDRRDFLRVMAGGGLCSLFGSRALALAQTPHFPPRVKRVLFLFMFGGPSQMDLFDYKPELQKNDGKSIEFERRRRQMGTSHILGSKRSFKQYGETGQWCSDAFQHLPQHIDKLAIVKSLYTDSFAHGSALLQMNTGQILQGHPSMGAWVTYGLGTENPDLPGFVVMCDPRGGPISGPTNWSSGYIPASYQGTLFRAEGNPLLDLEPGPIAQRAALSDEMQRSQIDLIHELNELHAEQREGHGDIVARDSTYELAYRLQAVAPAILDLSKESEETKRMYGLYDPAPDHPLSVGPAVFGRQCLIARRLLESGVRFVQIYHGGGHQQQTWDAHTDVEENLAIHCPEVDRPLAGLLTDLERTGLLEDTLVIWGGEFGRQPVSQLKGNGQIAAKVGRDHNPKALTMWFAGGGIRPGSYGATDELGGEAVEKRHHLRDLHATILHLLGLRYDELTFHYGGLDRKLTGVIEPNLIEGILA